MDRFSVLDQISRGVRGYVLLFLLTFIAAAPGVFNLAPLDRDESRFAQASKQMLETNDYLIIRNQDEQRNKKPAGIYWLQAASTAVFSSAEAQEIWSYRIPSWIAAALTTSLVFWAGMPLVGRRAAFLGAALFGAGLLVTTEAHIAKTDATLLLATTLALGALAHLKMGADKPKRLALIFWFAIGFGFLIKGPVTPMVAVFALVFSALSERGWKPPAMFCAGLVFVFLDAYVPLGPFSAAGGILFKVIAAGLIGFSLVRVAKSEWRKGYVRALSWWPGPVLFVLMVLPWLIAIQIATDGQFLAEALGKDLGDKVGGASEGHSGPPGYHLLYLLTHFFPATLFLIPALFIGAKASKEAAAEANGVSFLWAWLLPTWLMFEVLPTKLSHYEMPVYPALGLLCGYGILQLIDGARAPIARYASLVMFLLGGGLLALIASPVGVDIFMSEGAGDYRFTDAALVLESWEMTNVIIWPLIFIVAGLLLSAFYFVVRRYQFAVVCAVAASLFLGWHIRTTFLPEQNWLQASVTARASLEEACASAGMEECEGLSASDIQIIGFAEPSFVFANGTDVQIEPHSSRELRPLSEANYSAFIINLEDGEAAGDVAPDIRAAADAEGRCVYQSELHHALNYSNGSAATFQALLVGPEACQS